MNIFSRLVCKLSCSLCEFSISREKSSTSGRSDQFIKIEKGKGEAIIGNEKKKIITLEKGDCIIIPSNTYHEIKNIGKNKLKLFTIYTPPEHDDYRIDKKKPI